MTFTIFRNIVQPLNGKTELLEDDVSDKTTNNMRILHRTCIENRAFSCASNSAQTLTDENCASKLAKVQVPNVHRLNEFKQKYYINEKPLIFFMKFLREKLIKVKLLHL